MSNPWPLVMYLCGVVLTSIAAKAHLSGKRTGCLNIGLLIATAITGFLSTFGTLNYFFGTPSPDNGGMDEMAYSLYALLFLPCAVAYFVVNLKHSLTRGGPQALSGSPAARSGGDAGLSGASADQRAHEKSSSGLKLGQYVFIAFCSVSLPTLFGLSNPTLGGNKDLFLSLLGVGAVVGLAITRIYAIWLDRSK